MSAETKDRILRAAREERKLLDEKVIKVLKNPSLDSSLNWYKPFRRFVPYDDIAKRDDMEIGLVLRQIPTGPCVFQPAATLEVSSNHFIRREEDLIPAYPYLLRLRMERVIAMDPNLMALVFEFTIPKDLPIEAEASLERVKTAGKQRPIECVKKWTIDNFRQLRQLHDLFDYRLPQIGNTADPGTRVSITHNVD